jgi:hypothetical protein
MDSRMRAALRHAVVVPVVVVVVALLASAATTLRFELVVLGLSVLAVLGWLAMVVDGDGPVVTENTDSFGLSRNGKWNMGDPAANADSFTTTYRYYVSLVAAAVLGWGVLLVGP